VALAFPVNALLMVVVVLALSTVWVKFADVLPVKFVSPL
jgi:hypothetical protein